ELDAELRDTDALAVVDHMREHRLAVIRVEAEAAVGDAAVALHVRGLDDHKAGAGIRQHAEMRDVPVAGDAVVGAVLAHRRDDDAVVEGEGGEPERREQGRGHGRGVSGVKRAGNRWGATYTADRTGASTTGWRFFKSSPCLSMIFSENRYPLFGIMLYPSRIPASASAP